ncbi:hypothetical protein RND71_011148 [Anisodus tanguticus]|uniref:Uncharacterized protein n=1 Tax=Anisodus tanguticus TaxID=243964 RepID=A0AAE1SEA9_9SOLA|nr:hypothetical protein RND71_011148 [Anisodus tanguticus]
MNLVNIDIERTTLCQSISEDQTSSNEKKQYKKRLIKQESPFSNSLPRRVEGLAGAAGWTKKTSTAFLPLASINRIVCEHQ